MHAKIKMIKVFCVKPIIKIVNELTKKYEYFMIMKLFE